MTRRAGKRYAFSGTRPPQYFGIFSYIYKIPVRGRVQRHVRSPSYLVISKTFVGLRFQESILKRVAAKRMVRYHVSTPDEESRSIDGFIGNQAVSIKPITYKTKAMLPESIDAEMIYYEKVKDGILVFLE